VIQLDLHCNAHNRALTPTYSNGKLSAPKQPFGKQWTVYNIEAECEVGKQACATHWAVTLNGK
jgi:hypothetical protein